MDPLNLYAEDDSSNVDLLHGSGTSTQISSEDDDSIDYLNRYSFLSDSGGEIYHFVDPEGNASDANSVGDAGSPSKKFESSVDRENAAIATVDDILSRPLEDVLSIADDIPSHSTKDVSPVAAKNLPGDSDGEVLSRSMENVSPVDVPQGAIEAVDDILIPHRDDISPTANAIATIKSSSDTGSYSVEHVSSVALHVGANDGADAVSGVDAFRTIPSCAANDCADQYREVIGPVLRSHFSNGVAEEFAAPAAANRSSIATVDDFKDPLVPEKTALKRKVSESWSHYGKMNRGCAASGSGGSVPLNAFEQGLQAEEIVSSIVQTREFIIQFKGLQMPQFVPIDVALREVPELVESFLEQRPYLYGWVFRMD